MPNCDFYACIEDHEHLLSWLFDERSCLVLEHSSEFGRHLKQFQSPADVLAEFENSYPTGERWNTVHLQLYVLGSGPPFEPQRLDLGSGEFRFFAEGWGLVQLYLAIPTVRGLENSHTNHNSEKRAQVWAPDIPRLGDPSEWNFQRVTSFSSRLNRHIKKLSVGKIGSRPVLPGAMRLWSEGKSLIPYSRENAILVPVKAS
jgi:hypothetical protein